MITAPDTHQPVVAAEDSGPPIPQSPCIRRFTLDGDDDLERHLARVCKTVLSSVQKLIPPHKLEALLLGGGYGRGEGGVLKTAAGDRPYNDLEFYVFIRGNDLLNEKFYGAALHRLGEELAPDAGVEVEFKIISADKLRRSPVSMFYYDLVMGHRLLCGGMKLLAGCGHHCDAQNIPLSEATRLMMNRCSGLLFAREKLEQKNLKPDDADFIGRNLAKAQMAFGDAVLTAFGQYHWSCLKRYGRLQRLSCGDTLPWLDEVRRHHALGVEFKLHPRRTPAAADQLRVQHEEITAFALKFWLWLEGHRLGCHFEGARNYALNPANKFPGTKPWHNYLRNVKLSGATALFQKRSFRHPREKIVNMLVLMLWGNPLPEQPLENSIACYRSAWCKCN